MVTDAGVFSPAARATKGDLYGLDVVRRDPVEAVKATGDDAGLFDLIDSDGAARATAEGEGAT